MPDGIDRASVAGPGVLQGLRCRVQADLVARLEAGLNDQHRLRYIKTGMKHFPLWSIVEPLAIRPHQAIAPVVGLKSFNKSFRDYQ